RTDPIGSPPRAWGRRKRRHKQAPQVTVHPHVRGDDACQRSSSSGVHGSPPRAWGRRTPGPPCGWGTSVHPHVRGDDSATDLMNRHWTGSPPRAWGRRRGSPPALFLYRFTPTCVGTTHHLAVAG